MTRAFSLHKDSVRSAREPHPIAFAYKTLGSPIATRDASVLSPLHRVRRVSSAMKEASARVSRPSTPPPSNRNRAKPSRALRDICDREHARASAQLRGISRGTTCMRMYIYLLLSRCRSATPSSVAWSRSRDHRRRMRSRDVFRYTHSGSSSMDGNWPRSRIHSPGRGKRAASIKHASQATWIPAGNRERSSTCTCTCRCTTVIFAPRIHHRPQS